MRVLLTNDDGIDAPGLRALAQHLSAAGHQTIVLAPAEDCSASGAALGPLRLDRPSLMRQTTLAGLESIRAYSLPSPPALCVLAAFLGGPDFCPDVVVSGINAGPNTGRVILHSGTVGAALVATHFGARALAVSHGALTGPRNWFGAAKLAAAIVPWLYTAPPKTVINLNVPQTSNGALPRIRPARLADFGREMSMQISPERGGLHELHWRQSAISHPADTDAALLSGGFATMTSLSGLGESDVNLDELMTALNA